MIKKSKLAKSLLALVLSGTMLVSNLTPAMAAEVTGSEVQVESDSSSGDEEQGSQSETEESLNGLSEIPEIKQSEEKDSEIVIDEQQAMSAVSEIETADSKEEGASENVENNDNDEKKTDNEIELLDTSKSEYAKNANIDIESEWDTIRIVKTGDIDYTILEAFDMEVLLKYENGTSEKYTEHNEFQEISIDYYGYYDYRLKSSNGKLYDFDDAPNGIYTLVLGYVYNDDDSKYIEIGENTAVPIEVYDLNTISKNTLTLGKNSVSAYGDKGLKVIYAFTPTETGRYCFGADCGYECLQEFDIEDDNENEGFEGRAFLLEKGKTYDFLFYITDHPKNKKNREFEIYLNKSKKATQIEIQKGTTEYCSLVDYPYFRDWKAKFTYDDGKTREYTFEQLWDTVWIGDDDYEVVPRLNLMDSYGNCIKGYFQEDDIVAVLYETGTYEVRFEDVNKNVIETDSITIRNEKEEDWAKRSLTVGSNEITLYPYTMSYRWKITESGTYKIEGITDSFHQFYGGKDWTFLEDAAYYKGYVVISAPAGEILFIKGETDNKAVYEKTYTITKLSTENCQHIYSKNETPATCENAGSIDYTCKLCGDHYTETIPATGHRHTTVKNVSNPTCTTKGYSGDTYCTDCGKKLLSGKWTNAYGHALGANKVTKKATAVSTGWQTRTCSRCGYSVGSAIAKLPATGTLSAGNFPLKVKQSYTLCVDGMAAGDYVVSWTSSNVKTATVNASGKVTGKKKGTATITAKLASGKVLSTKVKVQKGKVNTTKVTVNTKNITLKKGAKFQISAVRLPVTTQQGLTYSSSSKKIATVDKKGRITAKKKGKAKITVKSGKKSVKISVNVIE